mmetsp:Transcript_47095/g.114955  ORF Transcript_47095/g.114955 Transcript_47095/m.114955 type:complete len:456 (+) Transcript_47095:142-1509(+)
MKSSSTVKLNPTAVRERAKSVPGCKEVLADGPTVLSFIVGMRNNSSSNKKNGRRQQQEQPQAKDLARVNIWTDSGTVGTSRVVDGKVRQSFRRHVQSLDVIERLLRSPEGPVEINESLIGMTDDSPTSLTSPRLVQKEVELADVGLCILQGENAKLQKHLDCVIEMTTSRPGVVGPTKDATKSSSNGNNPGSKDKNTMVTTNSSNKQKSVVKQPGGGINYSSSSRTSSYTASDRDSHDDEDDDGDEQTGDDDEFGDGPYGSITSSSSSLHGTEFHFKLPTDVMNQVDQCLRDIAQLGKPVKGVATNGKGTVFLYGNGGVAYTPSIPRQLYQKLRQLRSSSYSSRPCFVALGTRDRYYVSFNDGTADWKGPGALDKILKKAISQAKLPRCVAFGSTYDSFFVVFHDGSWQYQGRGIPETLEAKLNSRNDRADLEVVNLGPSGEWFVKAENGRVRIC